MKMVLHSLHPSSVDASSVSCPQDKCVMSSESSEFCRVCKDKATGIHYGAPCCDACKRFFHRACDTGVGRMYSCRFSNSCDITPITRNTCRRCRLRKCYKVGMMLPFVQSQLYPRIIVLEPKQEKLEEEAYAAFFAKESVMLLERAIEPGQPIRYVRTLQDVVDAFDVFHYHFVKWADRITLLRSLGKRDKGALVRANTLQRFVVDMLYRSRGRTVFDLGTGLIYTPEAPGAPIDDSVTVLFASMRETLDQASKLVMDEREFGFLRLLGFLNYRAKGLKDKESVQILGKHFRKMLDFEESDIYPNTGRAKQFFRILRSTGNFAEELRKACLENGRTRLIQTIARTYSEQMSDRAGLG